MKHHKKINWLPVSERFSQHLCSSTFKFFKETCPLFFHDIYRQSSQNQANTRSPVKKHVFWSQKVIVSDTNSLEQFANGPEVGKFT